jgi:hypothetical protein
MKKFIVLSVILVLFIGLVGCSTSTSTNSNVKFEIMGYFKTSTNESVTRVQSVYVENFKDDPQVWADIENYAKNLEWISGDMDVVFFFNDRSNTPADDISLASDYETAMNFAEKYNQYCVAGYWHYTTGKEQFTQFPFKE